MAIKERNCHMVIQIPDEQRERIETLAHERGYDNATDYVLALIDADEEELDFIDDPEEDAIDLEADFREAWRAAMTGEGLRSADEVMAEIRARREKQPHGTNAD
jgi:Arc/MetJ-type ribon-helix-helix transcriptional regulator